MENNPNINETNPGDDFLFEITSQGKTTPDKGIELNDKSAVSDDDFSALLEPEDERLGTAGNDLIEKQKLADWEQKIDKLNSPVQIEEFLDALSQEMRNDNMIKLRPELRLTYLSIRKKVLDHALTLKNGPQVAIELLKYGTNDPIEKTKNDLTRAIETAKTDLNKKYAYQKLSDDLETIISAYTSLREVTTMRERSERELIKALAVQDGLKSYKNHIDKKLH